MFEERSDSNIIQFFEFKADSTLGGEYCFIHYLHQCTSNQRESQKRAE